MAPRRAPELRRRASEDPAEHRREVAVTGKPDVQRERGQIVRTGESGDRPGEAALNQVLMQREPFDPPEQLGEVHR